MTRTCLIVDDSAVTRRIERQIVESLGFLCDEAADGDGALDYCRRHMPQAILLDWNMPKVSGYDFLLALRALPDGDAPVVIFCTSRRDTAQIALAMMHGANEYLMKPFDPEAVRAKFVLTKLLSE